MALRPHSVASRLKTAHHDPHRPLEWSKRAPKTAPISNPERTPRYLGGPPGSTPTEAPQEPSKPPPERAIKPQRNSYDDYDGEAQ
eukprot:3518393-Pyramimonas_sp.AAC.1